MAASETPVKLANLLSPEQFLPDLTVPDRWVLIETLVDQLVRLGKIRPADRALVLRAIKDRENTKSTGIGFGVALPHASVGCVTEVVAIVARLNPPVDFLALDNQPVKLCVLFVTPQGQFQKHLHTLSAFARLLSDKDRRQKLETVPTAEAMRAVFQTAS